MPGRQAHGHAPTAKRARVRNTTKTNAKRSQDAFAIALEENEERVKIRKSRLGHAEEGDSRSNKRSRDESADEDDENEEGPRKQRKRRSKDPDVDAGSDSEGNEWRMGEVGSDEDSDLDSDEAFGESDEEKFDGYAFSGSTKKTRPRMKQAETRALDLYEESEDEQDSDDESLGEDAIDLATMLDQTAEESGDESKVRNVRATDSDEDETAEGFVKSSLRRDLSDADSDSVDTEGPGDENVTGVDEDEEIESDTETSVSSVDDDDAQDPEKLAAISSLVDSLPQDTSAVISEHRTDGGNEYVLPSATPFTSGLSLADLDSSAIRDPSVRKAMKTLADQSKTQKHVAAVPLPKRQQDRLDRAAAYEKSKETLDRWTDTVKHNRRAEHLSFPLPDPALVSMKATNAQLRATTTAKPFNELEAAIQSIMEESGLAPANGKTDEDVIQEFEELQTNKLSLEEVKARRDELRRARELMFREEAKAKRIKKIKSKSYRKVHRKQREREEEKDQARMIEEGFVPSEDEQEAQDRRRAMERMGDKHRGSRWAKSIKATGRAAWDEEARSGVSEMARRDEELRKRVEGRSGRADDEAVSSESDDNSAGNESDEELTKNRLKGKLNRLTSSTELSGHGAKLAGMKFMLKADNARKRANDEMVEEIRRELDSDDAQDHSEVEIDVGRRTFGFPVVAREVPIRRQRGELEEGDASLDEEDVEIKLSNDNVLQPSNGAPLLHPTSRSRSGQGKSSKHLLSSVDSADIPVENAWAQKPTRSKDASSMSEAKRAKQRTRDEGNELDISAIPILGTGQSKPAKSKSQVTIMHDGQSDDDSEEDNGLPFAVRDSDLVRRAFAGDQVEDDFALEKRQQVEDDDEKVVDNTLPGWGSWAGDGLTKREKKKNVGRFLTKTEGIKEANRKDAKLERVIINEKRVKKNSKYLASQLPHTFETRQQYERSLRMPVGPEWTTKETFQDATKPRILLKQGIIAPMSKPLIGN